MSAPSETDLDLTSLSTYLAARLDLAGPITASLVAGGRSNPTYALTDGESEWILRRPPYGEYVAGGHDVLREARVMSALAGTDVPVPAVVAQCDDARVLGAPFYLMDRLDGRTFRSAEETGRLTESERAAVAEAMLDTLVALHSIDPASVGMQEWGRPDGYLERQIRRWARQWELVATSERPEVAELTDRLTRSMPFTRHPGIVHGDYKIDNLMVDRDRPDHVLGVLDWEMAALGDTLADLGLLVSFWGEPGAWFNPITNGATALPGFPGVRDVIEGYARRRDLSIDDLDWYVVFADFKIAVILEQIHSRHLRGTTVGEGLDDIGDMVGPLLARALERASASADPLLRAR